MIKWTSEPHHDPQCALSWRAFGSKSISHPLHSMPHPAKKETHKLCLYFLDVVLMNLLMLRSQTVALWPRIYQFKSWLCHKPLIWLWANLSLSFLIWQTGIKILTDVMGLGELKESIWQVNHKWQETAQMELWLTQWICGSRASPWELFSGGCLGVVPWLAVAQPPG